MVHYCRFSDRDWTTDLDIREADGEFVTVVASFRYQFNDPLPPAAGLADSGDVAYVNREIQVLRILDRADKVQISAPGIAGKTFRDRSPIACADRMEWLITQGFRVPEWAREQLHQRAREAEEVHA